ncbi:lantibiotic dehydratase [Cytobacillus oceanisediminis]|uniref:lantibiotic dehydratase n=1 Tax=Cytobacillus oceanisediminis TaxID=665099 RepID=UPI00249598B6|nr:lantibiotic dehydratase [Cytobacillus oceanisediminis]
MEEKAVSNRTESVFESEDYFLLRTPFKSLDDFSYITSLREDELLLTLKNDKKLIEAIAVSSPNLYSMIKNGFDSVFQNKNNKKGKQVISSLIRYALRGCSRPTPFGMFSGVSSGRFDEAGELAIKIENQFTNIIRPDMEWLLHVVRKLEKSDGIIEHLKVKNNQALHKVGSRIHVRFMVSHGLGGQKDKEISVSATEVLEKVLEYTNDPIDFRSLRFKISCFYPDVDISIIHTYLKQLIDQEVLISELKPSVNNTNSLDYITSKLTSIYENDSLKEIDKEYIEKVLKVKRSIDLYNNSHNINYFEICIQMKNVHDIQNPLQLDSFIKEKDITLPKEIKQDLSDAAECLWKLNRSVKNNSMEEYKNKFIERYGLFHKVSLLDAISSETGIGYPDYDDEIINQSDNLNKIMHAMDASRQITLNNLITMAIQQKEHEINLTDEIVDKLISKEFTGEVPEGIDLYAEVIKGKDEKYIISCNPQAGAQGVGKSFGRFLYQEKHLRENFLASHRKVMNQNPSIEYAEIVYIPPAGKSANVMQGYTPTKYELNLSSIEHTGKSMDLQDLFLVAEPDRIVIYSKKLKKEIRFITSNMFNYSNAPRLCRFLLDITQNHYANWSVFNWQLSQFSNYLPRIRRGNVILYPQTWRFHKGIIDSNKEYRGLNIEESIRKWISIWNVPRFVYLTFSDLRLLVDLRNEIQLKEVVAEAKKKGQFELQEFIGDFQDRIVESVNGKHTMEAIFPLIRKKAPLTNSIQLNNVKDATSFNEKRTIYPGEECLYVKLYGALNAQEEFISDHLLGFMNELEKQELIEKWFYIRYFDPEPHIRLRMFGKPQVLTESVYPVINSFIRDSIHKGYLKHYVIEPYEREIERYGGGILIDKVEEVFWRDSVVTGKMLSFLNHAEDSLLTKKEILSMINIVDLLDSFGLTDEDIFHNISHSIKTKDYMEKYRIIKQEAVKLLNRKDDWSYLRKTQMGNELLAFFSYRKSVLNELAGLVRDLISDDVMNTQQSGMLIDSLIHMTCNRFLGAGHMEDEVRVLLHMTLKSISHINKQIPKKVLVEN